MSLESPSVSFPVTTGRRRGYDPAAVDAFLSSARTVFESAGDASSADRPAGENPISTAADVRRAGFAMVRHGYEVDAVDAALSRIEDAFAAREREQALSRAGARAWVGASRKQGQEVLDRLSRSEGRRFRRVPFLRYGYRIDEVDLVADRIAGYLEDGDDLSVEQVRSVAFRMQRRGYSEAQVDAVLDAVVEVMLAVG